MEIGWFLVGILAGYAIRSFVTRPSNDESDGVEEFLDDRRAELQDRYETGPMDYVEFGDRVAVLEDPRTERIIRDAVGVDGIGVETAFAIAKTFDSDYDAYASASRDELERVNGIGENRATALLNR